jgi:hypothetical protein
VFTRNVTVRKVAMFFTMQQLITGIITLRRVKYFVLVFGRHEVKEVQ